MAIKANNADLGRRMASLQKGWTVEGGGVRLIDGANVL